MSRLDELLPVWDVRERHERLVPAPPAVAVQAALGVPVAPDRLVRALFRVRGLGGGGSIGGALRGIGLALLVDEPECVVFGAAGRPWSPRARLRPFASARPGEVRMAASIEAAPAGTGALLVTETRVAAEDAGARRAFARYWFVVGPFSGLIRRRWLAAAERVLR